MADYLNSVYIEFDEEGYEKIKKLLESNIENPALGKYGDAYESLLEDYVYCVLLEVLKGERKRLLNEKKYDESNRIFVNVNRLKDCYYYDEVEVFMRI